MNTLAARQAQARANELLKSLRNQTDNKRCFNCETLVSRGCDPESGVAWRGVRRAVCAARSPCRSG